MVDPINLIAASGILHFQFSTTAICITPNVQTTKYILYVSLSEQLNIVVE